MSAFWAPSVIFDFPATAPAANPVFYRTYSRRGPAGRESWSDVAERSLEGLRRLGQLDDTEVELLRRMQLQQKALPSGRWLWIGGTDWIERPENFSGAYNCTSTNLVDWEAFALMMDLAMMGCGTGAIIEPHLIERLPLLRNPLEITIVNDIGITPAEQRQEHTSHRIDGQCVAIKVGDTRQGWVESYRLLLELSSDSRFDGPVRVAVNLADVRPVGESLKGFGGMANPVKLRDLYGRVAVILNRAQGRRLTSVECCLLIDEAAVTIVAGNIRRSAGMRQFAADDLAAASAKDNLWQQDSDGSWRIDPERDALRMANHTRVFHNRPTRETVLEAVIKQFHSGEGAIQFAPEAIARSNADLLPTPELRTEFIEIYCDQGREEAGRWNSGAISAGPGASDVPSLSTAALRLSLGSRGSGPFARAWVGAAMRVDGGGRRAGSPSLGRESRRPNKRPGCGLSADAGRACSEESSSIAEASGIIERPVREGRNGGGVPWARSTRRCATPAAGRRSASIWRTRSWTSWIRSSSKSPRATPAWFVKTTAWYEASFSRRIASARDTSATARVGLAKVEAAANAPTMLTGLSALFGTPAKPLPPPDMESIHPSGHSCTRSTPSPTSFCPSSEATSWTDSVSET